MGKSIEAQLAELLRQKRELTCQREVILAKAEKKIATLTAEAEQDTLELDRQLVGVEQRAIAILDENKKRFKDPRTLATPDGKYGFRSSSALQVTDEDALVDILMEHGYQDCCRTEHHLNKPNIRQRLEAGEKLPGCTVKDSDDHVFEVKKALIKKAIDDACPKR